VVAVAVAEITAVVAASMVPQMAVAVVVSIVLLTEAKAIT